ncbi:PaaI family thioesterase [Nocardia brasiliensis]|uniref:PaaI family thioesterase n=1 Tax=Nocardia brasiliensis TaxID=37326 RepID=UPI0037ADCBF3
MIPPPRPATTALSAHGPRAGAALAPHHDHCYVCGPRNPAATGITLRRNGDRIVGQVCLDQRHQGVPGLAHGGAIAALVDETAGALLISRGLRFVTANLDVDYHAPVPIGRPFTAAARLDHHDGRKYTVIAELRTDTTLLATGRVLFLTVETDHFTAHGVAPGAFPHFGI